MILWELFGCQAFLVSSLFSGTVLVLSWNRQMPKHVKGKTLALWRICQFGLAEDSLFQAEVPFWGQSVLVLVEVEMCLSSWILEIVGTCCNF
jgi:hypothetical protein